MNARGHASTHVGRRSNNEDAYRVDTGLGLFVVADGMGGYEGGEIASRIVVDTIHDFFGRAYTDELRITRPTADTGDIEARRMEMAIRLANREIGNLRHGKLQHMGSTVASLLFLDDRVLIAHVGDSRVYRLRHNVLEAMTRDHSVAAQMRAASMGGSGGRVSSAITRAVGVPGRCQPEIVMRSTRPGDIFLLCTDGLTDMVSEDDIEDTLGAMPPYRAVDALVTQAYVSGGEDNITALVVEVH